MFIPFCYYEAAANLLTNPALDPFGKIPEFKYCAVRVTAGGAESETRGYGQATQAPWWRDVRKRGSLRSTVKALAFDVFGTVVDWRGSIIREGAAFGASTGSTPTGRASPTPGAPAIGPRCRRCAAASCRG